MKTKVLTLTLVIGALLLSGCNNGGGASSSTPSSSSEEHTHNFSIVKHDNEHHWLECSCGEKSAIEEHDLKETSHEEATCKHGEISHLKCDCGFEKVVDDENKVEHQFKTGLKVEPTCQEKGSQEFVCESCGTKFTEELTDANAHKWAVVSENDGIIQYSCSVRGCTATKKVISAVTKEETQVKGETLKETGEIALKNATIAMDEAIRDSLGESVTISAKNKAVTDIPNVKEETKELLGDANVVDLSLNNNGAKVSQFDGTMTISLPYTLKDGEDPDCLSILYLNEFGGTENIEGKYSDGKVTFETTHFSFYAVVKIEKEDLCATFGHHYVVCDHEDSTCVKVGHINSVCSRCNDQKIEYLQLTEHNYQYSGSQDSTETTHGYIAYKCSHCGDETRTELPLKEKEPMGILGSVLTAVAGGSTLISFDANVEANNVVGEAFLIRDAENKPIIAFNEGMGEGRNEKGLVYDDVTYSLTDLPDGLRFNKGAITDGSFGLAVTILDAIKSLPKSGIKILDFLSDTLGRIAFDKTEKEGLFEVSLNWDKVKATNEALNTLKFKEGINYLFGNKAYDFLIDLKDACYTETVKDVIDLLKEIGLDPKETYEFVAPFIAPDAPKYEDIMTEEMLKSNLIVLVSDLLHIAVPPKEAIDGMIDSFKDMTLYGVIEGFVAPGGGLKVYEIINQYIVDLSKVVSFSFTCTKTGAIIDGNFVLDNSLGLSTLIPEEALIKGKVTSAFEKEVKMGEAFDTKELIDMYCDKIAIGENCQLIVDLLNKQRPDLEFEFKKDYAGFHNVVVSKEGTYKVLAPGERPYFYETVDKVGRIAIVISDNMIKNTNGEVILDATNYFGDGFDAEFAYKDLYLNGSLRYGSGIGFIQSSNLEPFELAESYFDLSKIYASITGDNVFSARVDLTSQLLKLTPITKGQFEELVRKTGSYMPTNLNNYNLFRGVDAFTGKIVPVYIYKFSEGHNEGNLIFAGMDEVAKAAKITFSQEQTAMIDTFRVDGIDIGQITHEYDEASDEYILVGKNETVTKGNVKIEVTFKPGSNKCELIKTNKVFINGSLVYESNSCIHDDNCETEMVLLSETHNSCSINLHYGIVCKECGKTIDYYNDYESNHDYGNYVTYATKTNTQEGIKVGECSKCHDTYWNFETPCHHNWYRFDEVSGHYVCEDCHKDLGESLPSLILEDLTHEYTKYSDNIVIGGLGVCGHSFSEDSNEWSVYVCVSYTIGDTTTYVEESMIPLDIEANVVAVGNSSTSVGYIVKADKDIMKDFIESYVGEEKDLLKLTFVFTNNYDSSLSLAVIMD